MHMVIQAGWSVPSQRLLLHNATSGGVKLAAETVDGPQLHGCCHGFLGNLIHHLAGEQVCLHNIDLT